MQNKQKQVPKKHNSSQIRQIQNIFQNKTKQIKWKINLLQDRLEQFKKRRSLFQNGLQQISKMQNLSQNELDQITKMQNQPKEIVKMRRIKNCENTSTEGLLIALLKSEQSLDKPYNEVDETKKYLDHDDPDYEGIRNILFDEINADYYKPVKTKSAFIDNYIEYETREDKDKNLSPQQDLNMIRPYLRDMMNNHNALLEGFVDDDDHNLHGEWNFQLTMQINFASSLDPREIRTMDSKSNIKKILMGSKTIDIVNECFESFLQKYQEKLEEKIIDSKFVFENLFENYTWILLSG